MALHEKPYFLFPNVLKRWSFIWKDGIIKKDRWYFFFPKISSYSLDGKWKIIFPKKYMGIWYFLQISEKMVFPKTSHWNIIFLVVLSGKIVFLFPRKCYLIWKWNMIFLKKYMEIWHFLYVCINVTNMILPFCKKNQRWSSPEKIHSKWISQYI